MPVSGTEESPSWLLVVYVFSVIITIVHWSVAALHGEKVTEVDWKLSFYRGLGKFLKVC